MTNLPRLRKLVLAAIISICLASIAHPAAISGGSGSGGGGTPAGSTTELQFKNGSAFGATTGITWNSGTATLTLGSGVILDASAATALLGNVSLITLDGGASPSLTVFGQTSTDNNFFAASKGAILWYDGTGVRVVPAYDNGTPPVDGQTLHWDDTNKKWKPDNMGALYGSDSTKRLNQALSTYAAGTAYSLTTTAAALDLGTADPVLVIDSPGTYLLMSRVGVKYSGLTYVAAQTETFKVRRTNNTAADVSNSSTSIELPVLTTFTGGDEVTLPFVVYTTANSDDSLTIFGSISAAPGAGSTDVTEASIVAIRLYQ